MRHIRRITAAISTVILAVLGFFAAAPAAFAMRLDPPGGASAPAGASSGMAYWQVGLVALAAAVFAAVVTAIVLRLRFGAHLRAAAA